MVAAIGIDTNTFTLAMVHLFIKVEIFTKVGCVHDHGEGSLKHCLFSAMINKLGTKASAHEDRYKPNKNVDSIIQKDWKLIR